MVACIPDGIMIKKKLKLNSYFFGKIVEWLLVAFSSLEFKFLLLARDWLGSGVRKEKKWIHSCLGICAKMNAIKDIFKSQNFDFSRWGEWKFQIKSVFLFILAWWPLFRTVHSLPVKVVLKATRILFLSLL